MPQHVPFSLVDAFPRGVRHAPAGAPPPRRIVFLARRDLGNPAAGGSELLVHRLAEGLTRLGHQVTLLCGGPAALRDYRVVSAGGDLSHYLRARSTLARQVGDCDLLVEVWHQPWGGSDKTVDVHLSWLRRKLGETAAESRYLTTVRGVGVRLAAPEDG